MVCGRRETGSSAAPINAVSHWYWREEALYFRQTDIKHTVLGYLTHHGASVFWGALFAGALHGRPAARNPGAVLVVPWTAQPPIGPSALEKLLG